MSLDETIVLKAGYDPVADEDVVDVEVVPVAADGTAKEAGVEQTVKPGMMPAADQSTSFDTIQVEPTRNIPRDQPEPAATATLPRRAPPPNRTETWLKILTVAALAALLCLMIYLVSIVAPERYAWFRSLFPESCSFPPKISDSPMPGRNLPDQG